MFSSSASKLASQATQGAIKIGGIATQKVSDITTDLSSKVSRMLFKTIASHKLHSIIFLCCIILKCSIVLTAN